MKGFIPLGEGKAKHSSCHRYEAPCCDCDVRYSVLNIMVSVLQNTQCFPGQGKCKHNKVILSRGKLPLSDCSPHLSVGIFISLQLTTGSFPLINACFPGCMGQDHVQKVLLTFCFLGLGSLCQKLLNLLFSDGFIAGFAM